MTAPGVWVLADDRAGNVSQALGVAEALGLPFTIKDLRYNRLARLHNALLGASLAGIAEPSRAALAPPWPAVVIGAGRRTAPVARWIKRAAGGRTVLAQVMHPGRIGIAEFDVVAIPGHDRVPARGAVMTIAGPPHRATATRLAAEALRWRDTFAQRPRPYLALIVGGATRRRPFGPELAVGLGRAVAELAQAMGGAAVLATTSRRTGAAADAALAAALPAETYVYRWGDAGENPYYGLLGLADAVVVTGDSMSMCAEACGTAGPVYVFAPPGMVSAKHARFHAELYRLGLARPLDGHHHAWTHPPLDPAGEVAAAVRARLGGP